ncbi:MAG: hypothetical protein ACTSPI_16985, partial [Candidatus Heimdallarchaeaceae archaeon]
LLESLKKMISQKELIERLKREEAGEISVEEKDVIQEIRKELEGIEAEVKEGRVLSGKNRKLIKDSVSVLQDLLLATEDKPVEGGEGKLKGRKEEAQKSLKDRTRVRTLQKVSRVISDLLREEKVNK